MAQDYKNTNNISKKQPVVLPPYMTNNQYYNNNNNNNLYFSNVKYENSLPLCLRSNTPSPSSINMVISPTNTTPVQDHSNNTTIHDHTLPGYMAINTNTPNIYSLINVNNINNTNAQLPNSSTLLHSPIQIQTTLLPNYESRDFLPKVESDDPLPNYEPRNLFTNPSPNSTQNMYSNYHPNLQNNYPYMHHDIDLLPNFNLQQYPLNNNYLHTNTYSNSNNNLSFNTSPIQINNNNLEKQTNNNPIFNNLFFETIHQTMHNQPLNNGILDNITNFRQNDEIKNDFADAELINTELADIELIETNLIDIIKSIEREYKDYMPIMNDIKDINAFYINKLETLYHHYIKTSKNKKIPYLTLLDFFNHYLQIIHSDIINNIDIISITKVIHDKYITKIKNNNTYGIILLNKSLDKVLLLKYYNTQTWELPKGRIKNDESIYDCIIKELKEQTNYDLNHYLDNNNHNIYDLTKIVLTDKTDKNNTKRFITIVISIDNLENIKFIPNSNNISEVKFLPIDSSIDTLFISSISKNAIIKLQLLLSNEHTYNIIRNNDKYYSKKQILTRSYTDYETYQNNHTLKTNMFNRPNSTTLHNSAPPILGLLTNINNSRNSNNSINTTMSTSPISFNNTINDPLLKITNPKITNNILLHFGKYLKDLDK